MEVVSHASYSFVVLKPLTCIKKILSHLSKNYKGAKPLTSVCRSLDPYPVVSFTNHFCHEKVRLAFLCFGGVSERRELRDATTQAGRTSRLTPSSHASQFLDWR